MSADGSILDSHTVRFERRLPGPIDMVWDYLTKPELVATWLAELTLDPRVGGKIELRFLLDSGDACDTSYTRGTIQEWNKPHRLAFTWRDAPASPSASANISVESLVTFELASRGEAVLLTLTHRRLATSELSGFGAGWHAHLDYLEARMAGAAVEPYADLFARLRPRYLKAAEGVMR